MVGICNTPYMIRYISDHLQAQFFTDTIEDARWKASMLSTKHEASVYEYRACNGFHTWVRLAIYRDGRCNAKARKAAA